MSEKTMGKLRIVGSPQKVDEAYALLAENLHTYLQINYTKTQEGTIRTTLQDLIDKHQLYDVFVLYDGNSVWSYNKIVKDFKRIMNNGLESLTKYLYEYFHLCCGTIAHYNKHGWIDHYQTVSKLYSVVTNPQPAWATDRLKINRTLTELFESKLDGREVYCD